MHWFSLSWKKRCLSFFTLLFWNKNKEKKKKKESSVCPKWSLPISSGAWILLCLSSHQKDKAPSCRNTLGRGKTQRTGDWQEARAAAPAQMPTAKQVLRSSFRSGLFLLFFRLFLCWGWIRNKEKICEMTSQSLLEQENKPFMPLPSVLWEAKSFTMVNHGS